MALFTVSKPKPECSRSNSTNSQPAFFMMWPMPGVANSTMKCPSFTALVCAIAFKPAAAIISSPVISYRKPTISGRRSLANQIQFRNLLVHHQRRARLVEGREVPGLDVRAEGRAVIVDLVQHDAVGLARRFHHVEAPAPRLVAAGGAGVVVDQAAERGFGAGLQPEIHHDDEAAHSPPPFTRQ